MNADLTETPSIIIIIYIKAQWKYRYADVISESGNNWKNK